MTENPPSANLGESKEAASSEGLERVEPWKNRIVAHGEEDPERLVANPRNWRIHPGRQQRILRGAIEDVGFIRSVTVNRRSGYVLDGHLRVVLALRDGVEKIPVEYVDLSEEEERLALATLDPVGAMAAADSARLDELLAEVASSDTELNDWLAEQREAIAGPQAPEEFPTYDEDLDTAHECPRCGYQWS